MNKPTARLNRLMNETWRSEPHTQQWQRKLAPELVNALVNDALLLDRVLQTNNWRDKISIKTEENHTEKPQSKHTLVNDALLLDRVLQTNNWRDKISIKAEENHTEKPQWKHTLFVLKGKWWSGGEARGAGGGMKWEADKQIQYKSKTNANKRQLIGKRYNFTTKEQNNYTYEKKKKKEKKKKYVSWLTWTTTKKHKTKNETNQTYSYHFFSSSLSLGRRKSQHKSTNIYNAQVYITSTSSTPASLGLTRSWMRQPRDATQYANRFPCMQIWAWRRARTSARRRGVRTQPWRSASGTSSPSEPAPSSTARCPAKPGRWVS